MKRHESLHALSRHHHFALMESLFIHRAREAPAGERPDALKKVAQKFVRFWNEKGKLHFREEEEALVPAYAQHVPIESDPDMLRMLAEHAAIRASVARLIALLESEESVEEEVAHLGRLLHDHVRLEENVIFPRIESTLDEAELHRLADLLTELHPTGSCDV